MLARFNMMPFLTGCGPRTKMLTLATRRTFMTSQRLNIYPNSSFFKPFTPMTMCQNPFRSFAIITDPNDDGSSAAGPADSEAAAMASAEAFLNKVEEDLIIDEITSTKEWTTKVMDVKDKPIILDCYADWCSPCKKLSPILEKLTHDNGGKFKLIKLNIENFPQITKALQIKSIPTLFLIYRGNMMDQVTGVD